MSKKTIALISAVAILIILAIVAALFLLNSNNTPSEIKTEEIIEAVEVAPSIGPVNPEDATPYEDIVIEYPTSVDDWTDELGEDLDITEEEFPEFIEEVQEEFTRIEEANQEQESSQSTTQTDQTSTPSASGNQTSGTSANTVTAPPTFDGDGGGATAGDFTYSDVPLW